MRGLEEAYRALSEIYRNGAWIGEAIKRQGQSLRDAKGAFRLVYEVVEHDLLLEYRIGLLTEHSPKAPAKILLKMGMRLLDDSDLPEYAVVNEIAETAKKVGKGGVGGFLNAVLRRYAREGRDRYPTDREELLSVRSNLPIWLVRRYERELGEKVAEGRLLAPRTAKTHVRPSFAFGEEALENCLKERKIAFESTDHGVFLQDVGGIGDLLAEGKATVMSWDSLEVCDALPYRSGAILDLCAAPGGKSVYLSEKFDAEVVACDLHEHRLSLIESYAARMGTDKVKATLSDGRIFREEWRGAFSVVLVDAPCSGLGSLASNPDIALRRTEAQLTELIATQRQLLAVAGKYVNAGGALVYATCSDLPSEDGDIVRDFLREEEDFSLEKEKYTDPEQGGGDSYYCAVLRKKGCC